MSGGAMLGGVAVRDPNSDAFHLLGPDLDPEYGDTLITECGQVIGDDWAIILTKYVMDAIAEGRGHLCPDCHPIVKTN